jgi:hypothetical protein
MNDASKIAGEIHKAAENKAAEIQKNSYFQELQKQLAQKAEAQTLWAKGVDAKGATTYFINASSLAAQADFSTISTHVTSVKAPLSNRAILGMKIDFEEKSFTLKDLYMKAFIQSKSHNLIVAKLNGLKCAATGFLLSLLGSTSEELRKLQKKALGMAREENMRLGHRCPRLSPGWCRYLPHQEVSSCYPSAFPHLIQLRRLNHQKGASRRSGRYLR